MVSIFPDDMKQPIVKIIIGIIATGLIGVGIAFFQAYLFDPHLSLDYNPSLRTGCSNVTGEPYYEKCPDGSNFTKVYMEQIILKNWGPKQAKNVEVDIQAVYPVRLADYDCPESNATKTGFAKSFKLDFKRLSTSLDCQLTFENLKGNQIHSITAFSDDIQAYRWITSDLAASQFLYFISLAIGMITVSIALLVLMSYKTIKLVQSVILDKKLRFPKKVKSYTCHLMFEVPLLNGTDVGIQDASNNAITLRNSWLEKISTLSQSPIRELNDNRFGVEKILKLKEGEIKIAIQEVTTQQRAELYRSARIRLRSESYNAIEKTLVKGRHPCWAFRRDLHTEFDVESTVNTIRSRIGRNPISTSSIMIEGREHITNADYNVLMAEGYSLRILLYKGDENSGGSIELVRDSGEPNVGFFQIRKFLPLRTVLLILYGEIESSKILDLVKKSSNLPRF